LAPTAAELGERVAALEASTTEMVETVRRIDERTTSLGSLTASLDAFVAEHRHYHEQLQRVLDAVERDVSQVEHDFSTQRASFASLQTDVRWIKRIGGAILVAVVAPIVVNLISLFVHLGR
jgi:hypothetical protein